MAVNGKVKFTTADRTEADLIDYSVEEDATTLDPGNYNGGTGQVSVSMLTVGTDRALMNDQITLSDDTLGSIQATVRTLAANAGVLTVTADSVIALFNAYKTIKPYKGTFGNAMTYYFGLIPNMPAPSVDASLISRAVSYPGFKGNMYDMMKQIMAAEQIEMVLVSGVPTIRPAKSTSVMLKRGTDYGWTVDTAQTAKKVRVHYYSNLYKNDGEVYPVPPTPPLPGEDPSVQQADVYSVDANQTYTVDIQLTASLDNVNQPTCINFVNNQSYAGTNGVYAVAGNDGLPITAAQWTASGGSLSVRITDDPSIVRVTIVGANIPAYAPFQIAMTAGESSYYNALHITGDGVFQTDRVVDIFTGAGASATGEDIGIEVQNPFIDTLSKAMFTGQRTAGSTAINYTISGSVDDFDTSNNNEIGNIAGAVVQADNAKFRIDTVSTEPGNMTYTASLETTVADFNALGLTTAQFNALWSGKKALDFSLDPLKTS